MDLSIAIIDSGINPLHPHVKPLAGGMSFKIDKNLVIVKAGSFADEIGHGTAVAGVIRQKAPFAQIYAVKIFYEKLSANGALLLAGLEWAIESNMRIVHLSLGTEQEKYRADLLSLCRKASMKNIIITASGRNPDDDIFPACFKSVIGAYWNRKCSPEKIVYHPGCKIEFGACGWPRQLPGIAEEKNFKGHSFAAAHITGNIAVLLGAHPEADISWAREQLVQQAAKKCDK